MKETALPSPSIGGKGHHLRRIAAQAINYIQVNAPKYSDGRHPSALLLKNFFDACSTAVAPFVPYLVAVTSFTPTAKTYSIAGGAGQAGPTFSKGAHPATPSYTSSDPTKATVNASTGAVTPLVAGTTTITATLAQSGTYGAKTTSYVATITA